MKARHVILLLDIDDTLIDFESSPSAKEIYWNGVNPSIWKTYLNTLKKTAHAKGIHLHYGIATFKPSREDVLAAAVIEELNDILDPNLIFFTAGKKKTTHALSKAKIQVETEYKITKPIETSDVWLFDDEEKVSIAHAKEEGYSAAHANFNHLTPTKQLEAMAHLFKPMYESLGLLDAMPKIAPLSYEEENRFKAKKKSTDQPPQSQKTPLLAKSIFNFTDEELELVQSLDDDLEADATHLTRNTVTN